MTRDVIEMLDSHFRCLDEEVVCSRVRPFLPGLLQSAPKLRIPTPITVHVDQCPQCARDLNALRKLALDETQLERLGWLYANRPSSSLVLCWRARSSIATFSRGVLEGIPGAILDHLSTCPRCRADVYARRQAMLEERSGVSDHQCDVVEPGKLLDYVIPCGDGTRHSGRPDAAHVGTCPRCLETIQSLHGTVYGVIDRPESGVATIYHTIGDDEAVEASPGDPYADYPIRVQVMRRERQPVVAASGTSAHGAVSPQRGTVNPQVRRLLKTAVAAAAMIPLAILFFHTENNSGVTLANMIRACGQARNVRIVGLNGNADKVAYELWVARDLQLAGMTKADGSVIYDLAAKRKADVRSGDIVAMDDAEHAGIRRIVAGSAGFPLVETPPNAVWDRVGGDNDQAVYEWTWTKRTDYGRDYLAKCEVVIDTSTMLPASFRIFRKLPMDTEWSCASYTVFEYPTDAEMKSVMSQEPLVGVELSQ